MAETHEDREAQSDSLSAPTDCGLFVGLILATVAELRDVIGYSEEFYVRVSGSAHADARKYFLYGALDEAEKTALDLVRLQEMLSGQKLVPEADRPTRLMLSLILEQQSNRARRLHEVFVPLVLFHDTNTTEYYHHYLLLEEMAEYLHANSDLQEFRGARSVNVEQSIQRTVGEIIKVQDQIDLSRAWYAGQSAKPLNGSNLRHPNGLVSSAKSRIREALKRMTARERIAFGSSYGEGYGRLSETLHFSFSSRDYRLRSELPFAEAGRLAIFALAIIDRCHSLLERPSLRYTNVLARMWADDAATSTLLHNLTVRDIAVGDFVLAYGYLAEVLEIRDSMYGNRSYHVLFLDETMLPTVPQDWFPAQYVQRLFDRDDIVRQAKAALGEAGISPEAIGSAAEIPAEELQEVLRNGVQQLWKLGLKKLV